MFTFLVTFLMSIQDGLLYGLVASIALLLYQLSDVDCVLMGQEPHPLDDNDEDEGNNRVHHHTPLHLLSLRDNPRAIPVEASTGIIVIKPVASLFFGNAELLVETIEEILACIEAAREMKAATALASSSSRSSSSSNNECENDDDLELAIAPAASPASPLPAENEKPTFAPEPAAALPVSAVRPSHKRYLLTDHLGPDVAETNYILIDAGGCRLLDLWALSCLHRVVKDAAEKDIQVFMSNGGRKLKISLKACGLWEEVGGPLVMHSTEEVFRLLAEAPSMVRRLAAQESRPLLAEDWEDEEEEEEEIDDDNSI